MAMIEDDENKQFNAEMLYREWGRRFKTLSQYLKSIYYYEKSIENSEEDDLGTLLGLSEALKKSGQFKRAEEVAQKCMSIDPKHLGAYNTRIEALFDIAEFCQSLVYAHRGLRRTKHFNNAVLLGNGTVDDCVGTNVSPTVLVKLQPWIANLDNYRKGLLNRVKEEENEFEGIDEEETKFKVDDPKAQLKEHLFKLDNFMAMLYLDRSSVDKRYLQDMLKWRRALYSANKEGSVEIVNRILDFLNRLQGQQDALRTRRPNYVQRAHARDILTLARIQENLRELRLKRCLAKKLAIFMMRQLHETRLRRDYPKFFQLVDRTKDKIEKLGLRLLPERDVFLDALYQMVARVYLDPRNLQRLCFMNEKKKESYLRRALGLKVNRLPREEDLAWPFCYDVSTELNKLRFKLALAKRPLEILWIFHELCKHFLQINRYDLARFYSKKTRDLALETGYEEWALNGSHILLRIELAQSNRLEAKDAAALALESAKKLNVEFLIDFYVRTINYIKTIDFEQSGESNDGIQSRVRLVLNLASNTEVKPRLALLLRSIQAVPTKRRLLIMPGCKPVEVRSNKRSVIPPPPKNMEREANVRLLKKYAPGKSRLGFVDFSEYD